MKIGLRGIGEIVLTLVALGLVAATLYKLTSDFYQVWNSPSRFDPSQHVHCETAPLYKYYICNVRRFNHKSGNVKYPEHFWGYKVGEVTPELAAKMREQSGFSPKVGYIIVQDIEHPWEPYILNPEWIEKIEDLKRVACLKHVEQ